MDELKNALEKDPNLSVEERYALVEYLDNYVPRHERIAVPKEESSEVPEATLTLEEEVLQYVEERVIGFESAHPALTNVIHKMSAVLANMGI